MSTIPKDEFLQMTGKDLGASDWFKIDQERINAFADNTIDHQFIHVDEEAAKNTPFGSTIAHGFLSLSLITHLSEKLLVYPEGLQMVFNYGFDKIRFITPVKVNGEIRASMNVAEVTEKSQGILVKYNVSVDVKGEDKPAYVAEWLLMFVV